MRVPLSRGIVSPWSRASSSVCGVDPTDRTGKSSTTCWPGGTRALSTCGRRPWNPREIGDMALCLSRRVGRLRRRDEDRGPIDGPGAVGVARAAVVAVVQREGPGADERSGGDRERERVDADGDEYQAGA